ncbi:MAG: hypothetical protein USCGTAYLOR_00553 [Chromatiales bacterium USCg_Taylor]|nr:MAG: hypothetical protein USCGTAYLOR_00553 [Chromatiales bacterium USCg_Taylor]
MEAAFGQLSSCLKTDATISAGDENDRSVHELTAFGCYQVSQLPLPPSLAMISQNALCFSRRIRPTGNVCKPIDQPYFDK